MDIEGASAGVQDSAPLSHLLGGGLDLLAGDPEIALLGQLVVVVVVEEEVKLLRS